MLFVQFRYWLVVNLSVKWNCICFQERSPANDAAKRKEREMVQKEIDKLRSTIQTLTRSANPLGKIMDFIQEDLDQMQKELEMWKQEHKDNTLALQREQR